MGGPLGNKHALGNHNAGRKPLFKTADELQKKIDTYFKKCPDTRTITTSSGSVIDIPVITICGLAYFLGFESRQSFYDYEKNEVFSYVIKRARLKIESLYEQNLQFNNPTGSIFALKNMDWKDKTETDLKIEDKRKTISDLFPSEEQFNADKQKP